MPCAECRYYRISGESGSGRPYEEHGACVQPDVKDQVQIMWLGGVSDEAKAGCLGIRVRGDFGCDHFQEAPWRRVGT